ncbi:SRPBCC family protein [Mumia zhuanghuii]|uniref:SRPBCC family protein n=1 Tax=Mumia zhuanghuii TaxID=2585211 RepID=A0A5C4MQY9_9ACTN|nr:SRPBCC family protein [Mumia zhuanghuii]TNC42312.1 SRPBCC family protein [Mumia zhuanghuii]TNC46747.1 SRPBCC family protein [Mumia zhuanghuii]
MTTAATDPYLLETSTEVDASPREVWEVVSDLRRMPEWSPQTRKMLIRGPIGVGTRSLNLNKLGWRVWPTTSVVVRYEPQRAIAFEVPINGTVWSYELEDLGDGRTRLAERREAPQGTSAVSRELIKRFLGGDEAFSAQLERDMARTLARIKGVVERSV